MTSPTWYLGSQVAGFLLTYSLHSTLLLGAAWILSRFVFRREAWRDMAWKVALLGSLVTAVGAQVPGRDWAPRISMPLPSVGGEGAVEAVASFPIVSSWEAEALQVVAAQGTTSVVTTSEEVQPAANQPLQMTLDASSGLTPPLLVTAWAVIAIVLLARLARKGARLRSVLRDRRPAPDSSVTAMLEDLRVSSDFGGSVRLSYSDAIATPLALGRFEICLPGRFFGRLSEEEQRAALAHEMAHLVRRDPMWHQATQILAAVFFFQPLQAVAIRKLRESAEILADAWAVRRTGSPLGLARCLEVVAHWISSAGLREPVGSTPMAEAGSPLMTRVRRLLSGEIEEVGVSAPSRVTALAAVAVLAGFAPAVGPHAPEYASAEAASVSLIRSPIVAPGSALALVPTSIASTESLPAIVVPETGTPTAADQASDVGGAVAPATEPMQPDASIGAALLRVESFALVPEVRELADLRVELAAAPVRMEGIEAVREAAGVREEPESWVVVNRHLDPSEFDDLGRLLDQWSMNELALERRFSGMVVTHFRATRACDTFECRRASRRETGLDSPEPCGVRYFVDGVAWNRDLYNRPIESLKAETPIGVPAQVHGSRTSCGTIRR